MSLENPSNIDNFPTFQKNHPYYNWKMEWNNNNKDNKKTCTIRPWINNLHSLYLNCLSSYLRLIKILTFIKTKHLVRITLNGLMNSRRSVLTILLPNNGCLYQDPVLVAILRYFKLFFSQTFFTRVALKRDFLLYGQAFHLKIGASSKVTSWRYLVLKVSLGEEWSWEATFESCSKQFHSKLLDSDLPVIV